MHPKQVNILCPQLLQAPGDRKLQALRVIALIVRLHLAFFSGAIGELRRQNYFVSIASACKPFANPLLALLILHRISCEQ